MIGDLVLYPTVELGWKANFMWWETSLTPPLLLLILKIQSDHHESIHSLVDSRQKQQSDNRGQEEGKKAGTAHMQVNRPNSSTRFDLFSTRMHRQKSIYNILPSAVVHITSYGLAPTGQRTEASSQHLAPRTRNMSLKRYSFWHDRNCEMVKIRVCISFEILRYDYLLPASPLFYEYQFSSYPSIHPGAHVSLSFNTCSSV